MLSEVMIAPPIPTEPLNLNYMIKMLRKVKEDGIPLDGTLWPYYKFQMDRGIAIARSTRKHLMFGFIDRKTWFKSYTYTINGEPSNTYWKYIFNTSAGPMVTPVEGVYNAARMPEHLYYPKHAAFPEQYSIQTPGRLMALNARVYSKSNLYRDYYLSSRSQYLFYPVGTGFKDLRDFPILITSCKDYRKEDDHILLRVSEAVFDRLLEAETTAELFGLLNAKQLSPKLNAERAYDYNNYAQNLLGVAEMYGSLGKAYEEVGAI